MRFPLSIGLLFLFSASIFCQKTPKIPLDSDHDGISDSVENDLLTRFAPQFMVSPDDCSNTPALFVPSRSNPVVEDDNGTIYGQAFPRANWVELHYYHLWRRDCGEMGHDLDAEHVSALLQYDRDIGEWRALYWYAAAHENTICDASQMARGATVDAGITGARIWISPGKHASFLDQKICTHGCGGDRCERMAPLTIKSLINLGEPSTPMNGAVWVDSPAWPLADKLRRTDFTQSRIDRLERLPETDIAWTNPGKRPVQSVILGGNDALGGAATGARATNTALVVADDNTGAALDSTTTSTGNALTKSFRGVTKALRKTVTNTGKAIGID
ncbi:MAG: hypothetical protein QOJ42_6982 [Acidobacteriaceae bacterium]|nr:hypothetical protein [Acidobacteriaceae bacterium]